MNNYLTISEVAANWNISARRVQMLCAAGDINGAIKFGRSWAIPAEAEKPQDHRFLKFRTYANDNGFSLVELIVVVAIMAVLVGVSAPNMLRYVEKARMQKDDTNMNNYTQVTSLAMASETAFDELMSYAKSSGKSQVRLIFTPKDKVITVSHSSFEGGAKLTETMPTYFKELETSVAESVTLTSNTLSSCPYTVEIDIEDNSALNIWGYWGLAINGDLNVSNRDNELQKIFEAMMTAAGSGVGSTYRFKVYNSTYTNNNAAIKAINNSLTALGKDTDIKTWSIINDVSKKGSAYTSDNISYLISTVDISNTNNWSAGDQVPALLQKADGSIEVGMASLYLQKDGATPYYVISRDANEKYAENTDFDVNTVLSNKMTFSSLDEAYRYYETLSVIKTS